MICTPKVSNFWGAYHKTVAMFLAGAEGLEMHCIPLAVPKIVYAPKKRRTILTATPFSPRFIRHRRRFGDNARHAPRASGSDFTLKKHSHRKKRWLCFWQGQKDLNPRHAVLETAALPTELYPYKFGGPSGTRTPDQPVMSRLL